MRRTQIVTYRTFCRAAAREQDISADDADTLLGQAPGTTLFTTHLAHVPSAWVRAEIDRRLKRYKEACYAAGRWLPRADFGPWPIGFFDDWTPEFLEVTE